MGGSEGDQQIRTYKYQRMQMKRSMRGAQHDCGWRWRVGGRLFLVRQHHLSGSPFPIQYSVLSVHWDTRTRSP